MTSSKIRHPIATFIIRMWLEPTGDDAGEWRGQVEHVQSGERSYFHDLGRLVALITTHVPAPQAQGSDAGAPGAAE
jgi:hypothetical protein